MPPSGRFFRVVTPIHRVLLLWVWPSVVLAPVPQMQWVWLVPLCQISRPVLPVVSRGLLLVVGRRTKSVSSTKKPLVLVLPDITREGTFQALMPILLAPALKPLSVAMVQPSSRKTLQVT